MDTPFLPTAAEVLDLLKKTGLESGDKNSFIQAFKTLYPTLSDTQRTELLQSILAYADTLLSKGTLGKAA